MLRRALGPAVVLLILSFACTPQSPSIARRATELPRFELRGLQTKAERDQYSTSFRHTGSVVALGDSALTSGSFLVLLSVTRISRGNPETVGADNSIQTVHVIGGIGDFERYGGFRAQSERWEPEKIEVRIVGAVPVIAIADTVTYRN